MATRLWNYFGFGTKEPIDTRPSAIRALPASWYTSQEMYELERKAIFSRRWLLITHSLRLKKPGDFLRYQAANYKFILRCNSDGKIHGFFDTGRYSMYPAKNEDKDVSRSPSPEAYSPLSDFNEELVEAGYDIPEDFGAPIHIHIDYNGFVWVNFDNKQKPEIPWDEDFGGTDRQERFAGFDFDEYEFDHEWEMEGAYNWKILADNYNECYHCASTHPDLKEMADLETYSVTTQDGYILHNVRGRPGGAGEQSFKVHPTYYFPSTSMNVSPHFFFMQRFVPLGPVRSIMRYEVYRNKHAPEDEFQAINHMYKRVMSEDKYLCEQSQKNLNAGIFVNGEMHPRLEQGPLFFQRKCREAVMEFHKREQAYKR